VERIRAVEATYLSRNDETDDRIIDEQGRPHKR
jgi:hypothetical protein